MNIIVAPCGSGKTTAAISKLAPLASSPRKALFLIDTQNGNVRLANEDALTMPYQFYEYSVKNAALYCLRTCTMTAPSLRTSSLAI